MHPVDPGLGTSGSVATTPTPGDGIARHSRLIRISASLVLVGCLVWLGLALLLLERPWIRLAITLTIAFGAMTALWLTRRGHRRAAAWLVVGLIVAAITASLVVSGGRLDSPAVGGYLVAVIAAGVLLGGRAPVVVALFAAALAAGIGLAEERGLLAVVPGHTPLSIFWARGLILGAGAALVILATRELSDATDAARRHRHSLALRGAELEASEERSRRLAEHSNHLLAEWDSQGRVTYVSPNYRDALGYDAGMLLGGQHVRKVHPEDREALKHGLQQPGASSLTYRSRHADGSWRWLETTACRYLNAEGDERVLSISRDVTERVEEIERRRIRERAQQHSAKMEALGRLAGGVTHEFNNYLTAIALQTQALLQRLAEDDPARENAQRIGLASDQARELTRRLLAFSRRSDGRIESLELNAVVEGLAKLLAPMVGTGVEFGVTLAPQPCVVEADPSEIEQILVNLVVNAMDAVAGAGAIRVSVRTVELTSPTAFASRSLGPGSYVELAVEDSGVGMDEGARIRLFEPFFSTKDPEKRTGLGLSIVYGIVSRRRGGIQVSSRPGEGTRVEILLPRSGPEGPAAVATGAG